MIRFRTQRKTEVDSKQGTKSVMSSGDGEFNSDKSEFQFSYKLVSQERTAKIWDRKL